MGSIKDDVIAMGWTAAISQRIVPPLVVALISAAAIGSWNINNRTTIDNNRIDSLIADIAKLEAHNNLLRIESERRYDTLNANKISVSTWTEFIRDYRTLSSRCNNHMELANGYINQIEQNKLNIFEFLRNK